MRLYSALEALLLPWGMACAATPTQLAQALYAALKPLPAGDYLEDGVLAALSHLHSPNLAIRNGMDRGISQSISLAQANGMLRLMANDNWHEGYVLLDIAPDGRHGSEIGGANEIPVLQVDGRCHFTLRRPDPDALPPVGYSFVGDADRVIAALSLAGSYRTIAGQTVIFHPDGRIDGLSLAHSYRLNNDHAFANFDYFETVEDRAKLFAVNFGFNRLTLFGVNPVDRGPLGFEPDSKPLVRLLRTSHWGWPLPPDSLPQAARLCAYPEPHGYTTPDALAAIPAHAKP